MQMQQITIRVPSKYLSMIEEIAKSSGLKKSDITRMAIKEFIEAYSGNSDIRPYDRAKHFIGIAESGISDLGQHHRRHLLEKIKRADPCKPF